MVAISEPGGPTLYCVDRYEVAVTGELGSFDQYAADATPTTATTWPEAGQTPTTYVSFGQAFAACANTPVLDADGATVGYKRLTRLSSWQDAADGLVGEGGNAYPYGDEWDPDACATPGYDNEMRYEEMQPSGSFPGCVSDFGVYDQTGNAAEWTDAGWAVSIERWFEMAAERSLSIYADGDDRLRAPAEEVKAFQPTLHGITPDALGIDGDGGLTVRVENEGFLTAGEPHRGYLLFNEGGIGTDGSEGYLPVAITLGEGESLPAELPLYLLPDEDGLPVPAKPGCAYYVGDAQACATTHFWIGHFHDFDGTISFRCEADPI